MNDSEAKVYDSGVQDLVVCALRDSEDAGLEVMWACVAQARLDFKALDLF